MTTTSHVWRLAQGTDQAERQGGDAAQGRENGGCLWRTGMDASYTKMVKSNDSRHLMMRSPFWRVVMMLAKLSIDERIYGKSRPARAKAVFCEVTQTIANDEPTTLMTGQPGLVSPKPSR
jgi:hypothetical protein